MKRKILFIIILMSLFIAFISPYSLIPNPYTLVYAARPTEITYPEVPGAIRPVTIKTALPEYMRYIFSFFVMISGFICFGALIYGGIRYLISAGSPKAQKDAKDQIVAAFLGVAIVLTSYLLSKTINPQLVIPHAGIETVGGIVLGSEPCIDENTPGGETKVFRANASDLGKMADGETPFVAKSLKFASRPGELMVKIYPEKNFGGGPLRISSDVQTCHDGFEGRSIKLFWQLPGVYLCTKTYDAEGICQGEEKYLPADTALLPEEFNDNTHGLRLKTDATSIEWKKDEITGDEAWRECVLERKGELSETADKWICTYATLFPGVILHEHADWTGQCEVFEYEHPPEGRFKDMIINLDQESNIIQSKTSSVTVFARKIFESVDELKGGVLLCENANAQRNDPKCHGPYFLEREVKNKKTEAKNVEDKGIPNDSITSIIIDGPYIAILFDGANGKGKCQVFTKSDSNFRDDPIGRCKCIMGNWGCSDCLSSFIILPTK